MVRELYEVEHIVSMKENDGKRIFRVKWVGFPSWQNTWEPEEHLSQELIERFLREKEERKEKKEKRLEKPMHTVHKDKRSFIMKKGANIKIMSMNSWNEEEGLTFNVMYEGRRKLMTREHVFENCSEKLARFYLNMLLKNKK